MKFSFCLFLALLAALPLPAFGGNTTFIQGPTLIESVSSIATAAGTTTLTNLSNTNIVFTGSTTQTVTLPDATTLKIGRRFFISNESTGAVTFKDGSGTTKVTIPAGGKANALLASAATVAGTWAISAPESLLADKLGLHAKADTAGAADTAAALVADPAACASGEAVVDVAADGTLTCAAVASESGGGSGPKNFVVNPKAEDNETDGVLATVMTVARDTTVAPIGGVSSFSLTPSFQGAALQWTIGPMDDDVIGNCQADLSYLGGDGWKFEIADAVGGGTPLATSPLTSGTDYQTKSINYPCPSRIVTTGTVANGSACVASPGSLTGISVGQYVTDRTTAANIPAGTTVAALPGTCSAGQIQLSANATGAGTGDTLSFRNTYTLRVVTTSGGAWTMYAGASFGKATNLGQVNLQPEYDLTVTGISDNIGSPAFVRAVAVPYQTTDGAWRLRFNIVETHASGNGHTLTLTGVVFKNTANFYQGVAFHTNSSTVAGTKSYVNPNAGTINLEANGNFTSSYVSGDVELDSKPTWATGTTSGTAVTVDTSNRSGSMQALTGSAAFNTTNSAYQAVTVANLMGTKTFTGKGAVCADANAFCVSIPGMTADTYEISYDFVGSISNADTACLWELYDGADMPLSELRSDISGESVKLAKTFDVTYTTQASREFTVKVKRVAGTGACYVDGSALAPLRISVKSSTQSLPAPILQNQVSTSAAGGAKVTGMYSNCFASAGAIQSQDGSVASVGARSTATCTVTFNAGTFSSAPWSCSGAIASGTPSALAVIVDSATQVRVYGPSADYNFSLNCTGPR